MFLPLNVLDLYNSLVHQFPCYGLLLIEKVGIVEKPLVDQVSFIVSCDLRIFESLQHDKHLVLKINIA